MDANFFILVKTKLFQIMFQMKFPSFEIESQVFSRYILHLISFLKPTQIKPPKTLFHRGANVGVQYWTFQHVCVTKWYN